MNQPAEIPQDAPQDSFEITIPYFSSRDEITQEVRTLCAKRFGTTLSDEAIWIKVHQRVGKTNALGWEE